MSLSYYLVFTASSGPYLNGYLALMVFWFLFLILDYRQMALTNFSKTKSLKYQIYREVMTLEQFGPLAIVFFLGYTTPTTLDIVLTCLTVYLTISFLTYKYLIYRSTMVIEYGTYRDLEINRTLSDA